MRTKQLVFIVIGISMLLGCSNTDRQLPKGVFHKDVVWLPDGGYEYSEAFAQGFHEVGHFDLDGYQIAQGDDVVLQSIGQRLKQSPQLKVYIDGYTCELGGVAYNVALGYKRAKEVARYLIAQGAQPSQLILLSYGKEKPVDSGHSEQARQKNRRVEVNLVLLS